MFNSDGKFYLGRIVDPATQETGSRPLLYDPTDLMTHAVVVGMTGSGKTGLCLDLLEEAGLNNIPALMIDPKGDITNALLHFPDLAPADFEPWINADQAQREGKTVAEAAAATAALWRKGLGQWDIAPERIQALVDGPRFAVYTPGSTAGYPLSVLASLKAPALPWDENQDMLRERIAGTVTALLGLIGMKDIDPVRSREHILLANIFEHAWRQGRDLDLGELILQAQSPPFDTLGVFPVDRFFPEKDRFDLAMSLNNILAAPSFQAWREGEPLDVGRLLFQPDGRARHSIFYLAHLSDAERMFFVTLLYTAVESWMRTQPGTTSLRALVYFDETFGYLPPVGNPPSKGPLLRLLKQARAFGVGLVLATQNPVDVDYKALSNAGTWFIGKLGTDQDKQRLLDGLVSAGASLDRGTYDNLISALGKRVFLLRNVHEPAPELFQTRWAMNYLAGPATRAQIPALNALAEAQAGGPPPVAAAPGPALAATPRRVEAASARAAPIAAASAGVAAETSPADPLAELGSVTRPAVPSRITEYFLPLNLTLMEAAQAAQTTLPADARTAGILYRPALLAQAAIRFRQAKYNLNQELQRTALVHDPDRRGLIRWDDYPATPIDERRLDRAPHPEARFAPLEGIFSEARTLGSLDDDFLDWAYRTTEIMVRANEELKVYAGPEVDEATFARMCAEAAEAEEQAEKEKVARQFERRLESLKKKLVAEERELAEDEAEYKRRQREEVVKHAETIIGLFTRRRRSLSSSFTKRSRTERAKDDIQESVEAIERFKEELAELEEELAEAQAEVEGRWDDIAADTTEIPVTPYKKDITVSLFGVGWQPYHVVQAGGRLIELPGFDPGDAA